MQDSKSIKGALASADATTISSAPADDALHELTVIEAAARVSCGTVTSRQLVETCLRRINTHSHLNAFISVDAQRALAKADAYDQRIAAGEACLPLGGVPLAIKDNIAVGLQYHRRNARTQASLRGPQCRNNRSTGGGRRDRHWQGKHA